MVLKGPTRCQCLSRDARLDRHRLFLIDSARWRRLSAIRVSSGKFGRSGPLYKVGGIAEEILITTHAGRMRHGASAPGLGPLDAFILVARQLASAFTAQHSVRHMGFSFQIDTIFLRRSGLEKQLQSKYDQISNGLGRIAPEIGVDGPLKVSVCAEAPGALLGALYFLGLVVVQFASSITTQYAVGHKLLSF